MNISPTRSTEEFRYRDVLGKYRIPLQMSLEKDRDGIIPVQYDLVTPNEQRELWITQHTRGISAKLLMARREQSIPLDEVLSELYGTPEEVVQESHPNLQKAPSNSYF